MSIETHDFTCNKLMVPKTDKKIKMLNLNREGGYLSGPNQCHILHNVTYQRKEMDMATVLK
jgi:hypothetical protein